MSEDENVGSPPILDPYNGPVLYVDWVTSAGFTEGVVNLSLGAVDYLPVEGGDGRARVMSMAKLRMSIAFAERLGNLLQTMVADAKNTPAEDGTSLSKG